MTDKLVRWFNAHTKPKPKPQQNYELHEAIEQMRKAAENIWLSDGTNYDQFVAYDKSYQAAADRYVLAMRKQQ